MKRGISPLLSFILIILLIMTVFAFLFPWFTAFTRQLGRQGEETGNRPLYCDGVSLSVDNFTRNRESLYANLTIDNKGRFEIERFTITRETSYRPISSCLLLNANLAPNNKDEILVPLFAAFDLQSSLCPVEQVVSEVPCVFIKKIDLVPWINVNGIDISCVDKILEIDVSKLNAICGPIPVTPPSCTNGQQDPGEGGIDCGGPCVTNDPELCDGLDDNHDCQTDEGLSTQIFYNGIPPDSQNNPPCRPGIMQCDGVNGWIETQSEITPQPDCPIPNDGPDGVDQDCDAFADDGCLVWTSNRFEFEDNINSYNYPPTCEDINNPICVPECDCGSVGGYGGSYPRCGWLLTNNYCSRNTPTIDDFGSCKEEFTGSPYVPGQCVFLKSGAPTLINKERWFSYNLQVNIADPTIDLNLLECDIKLRLGGASDQDREDFFMGVNGQIITYLDDLNNPVETWEERTIGGYDKGRIKEGQNTIRVGNPKDPQEDGGINDSSSTHADWYQLLCYNPIVP